MKARVGAIWFFRATLAGDISRLTGTEPVDLVFTDPPYTVDYEGYMEEQLTVVF